MVISLSYLLTGGAAILAALFYLWTKKNSAEALNQNVETKEQVNELGKDISKNDGQLQSEEENRTKLQKESEEKKNENTDTSKLIDFFTKRRG